MEAIFLKLVNLSITAGWLVLAIMLLRLVFRRIPKWIYCVLWGFVAIRLICPVSLESALSLIPSAEPLPADIIYTARPQVNTGIAFLNSTVNPILEESLAPVPLTSANPTQIWSLILAVIWIAGCAGMFLYALISYILLRRRVATATLMKDSEEGSSTYTVSPSRILQSENVSSPFVFGLIRPRIYLPYNVDDDSLQYIIAHEKAHISRLDHWWKFLGFLLLAVYWFNPLMWAAYILLCRDIEAACDEKVINGMEKEDRQAYSTALLNSSMSISHRRIAACPLAFGEVSVKSRIKNVMNYRKPVFWIIVAASVGCAVLAVCFLTNPKTKGSADTGSLTGTPGQTLKTSNIFDAMDRLEEEITFSDEVYGHIADDWAKWNEKDSWERALSSSISGHWNGAFETWEEAQSLTGVTLWNPFEEAGWLSKMNAYGADIEHFGLLEHCRFTSYADQENNMTFADISAGYASGTTRVIYTVYLCPIVFNENNYDSNSKVRHIQYNRGNETYYCVAATRKGDKYDAVDLIFYKNDQRKIFIYLTSYEGTEELARVFDKVSGELGMSLTYDFLFNEYQGDTVTVTLAGINDSTGELIAGTPTPGPGMDGIPGTDANSDTDYFIDVIPGTDTGSDTDFFISTGGDDVTVSSLTLGYIPDGPMKPYDTTETGELGGYYFIPIDGKIYRYRLGSGYTDSVTKSGLIFEFINKHLDEYYSYSIYSVAEYPDNRVLYASWKSSYGHTDSILLTYWPAESSADGDLEKAVSDGFVVMDNGSAAYNRDKWTEFLEKTAAGEPATVRLGYYYTLDRERCSPEYYEAVKDDFPVIYMNELVYDGAQYTISPLHINGDGYIVYEEPGVDSPASTWKYLMHFTGEPSSDTALFSQYDRYVLTNDDTATWEAIEHGLYSSVAGAGIPHREVYNEYTWK